METVAPVISSLFSLVAIVLSVVAMRRNRKASKQEARDALGRKYAALAWAYANAHGGARKTAVEAFVLADTAADGRRDFTDKQVAVYLDSTK